METVASAENIKHFTLRQIAFAILARAKSIGFDHLL